MFACDDERHFPKLKNLKLSFKIAIVVVHHSKLKLASSSMEFIFKIITIEQFSSGLATLEVESKLDVLKK